MANDDDLILSALMRRFPTEQPARAYLERIRWPTGPVCPHCGRRERIYPRTPNAETGTRAGLYNCGGCRATFTVRVGTVMESSHVPLHKWLIAFFMMSASDTKLPALQLQRRLHLGSYRTALSLSHRIRYALKGGSPLGLGDVGEAAPYGGGQRSGNARASARSTIAIVSFSDLGRNVHPVVVSDPHRTSKRGLDGSQRCLSRQTLRLSVDVPTSPKSVDRRRGTA